MLPLLPAVGKALLDYLQGGRQRLARVSSLSARVPRFKGSVAAGRFRLETDRHGVPTGRFVYGKSYLARSNAVPIDPIVLKLSSQTCETRLLKGTFGALRDASPDYWGRRKNGDDHPRNHAVIAKENDWRLSPAYDLTPNPQISIERRDLALACGDLGRCKPPGR